MEPKLLLLLACLVALIAAAIFGSLAAYAELKAGQPKYSVYMKIASVLIGIAGVLAAVIAAFL